LIFKYFVQIYNICTLPENINVFVQALETGRKCAFESHNIKRLNNIFAELKMSEFL
jgi:hypothetical protein